MEAGRESAKRARARRHEERGGHDEPGERGRGGDGGGRDGRGCGGGGGAADGGVAGDGGAHPAHPWRHRQLHTPGLGDAGRALFKDLAADLEERLCTIHKERVEQWEEEIRELRARDAANEQSRALLHNAQLHLRHIVRD